MAACGLWPIVPPTTAGAAGAAGPTTGPGDLRAGPTPATGAGTGLRAGTEARAGLMEAGPTGIGPVDETCFWTPTIDLCSVTLVSEHT